MKYKTLLMEYFNFFSMKDTESLKALMSDDIVLKDWNTHVTGKVSVIEVIDNLFAMANSIKATPVSFFSNSDYSYAVQVAILVNKEPLIDVIDVIDFDTDGKIAKILAFKYERFDY